MFEIGERVIFKSAYSTEPRIVERIFFNGQLKCVNSATLYNSQTGEQTSNYPGNITPLSKLIKPDSMNKEVVEDTCQSVLNCKDAIVAINMARFKGVSLEQSEQILNSIKQILG